MQISDLDHERVRANGRASSSPREDVPLRQKAVILSTWHPQPADNGRKQRTRFIIESLATSYDIVLVTLVPEEEVGRVFAPVPGVWMQHVLPIPVYHPGGISSLPDVVSRYPRSIAATWDARTARSITELVQAYGVDIAIGTDLRTLRYLTALDSRVATYLDEPDVSPFVCSSGRHSVRALLRERKYRRLLERSGPLLTASVVASEQEASAYRWLSGGANVTVIENSVPEIPDAIWTPGNANTLLYTGSLQYGPNAEAVSYFTSQVLPDVETIFADVVLLVTGKPPETLPEALPHPRVRLTGRLDSLTDSFLQSRLFIAPILSGTGTRIKLLEAMAHGMPIVSTSKGAEGLPVEHDKHLLLADTADGFRDAVVRLLSDPQLSRQLGEAGRNLVRERFTWESQSDRLRALVSRSSTVNRMRL